MPIEYPDGLFTGSGSMLGGTSSSASLSSSLSMIGPGMQLVGAIQSGIGAYASAQQAKSNLEFQSYMNGINEKMSEFNAHMAENTAEATLLAGEKAQNAVSLKAGKIKGSQLASQGARGIQAGVGNAAEEIATTDLMAKEDEYTINANATRQAWNIRMQGVSDMTQAVNYSNMALMENASASTISPFSAMSTSLMSSGGAVADNWYKTHRANMLADALFGG